MAIISSNIDDNNSSPRKQKLRVLDSNIIVEDKTDPAKGQSNEYKPNEIFKFSDSLVDSLTSMIDREYKKKLN